jgi:cellulose synthase/poly-beta-1,6-N-acetylglucosamine synthase-like glycosyltransferase
LSVISVLPYGATLDYWWERTRGERGRLRFMAWKVVEVVAFCGLWPRSRTLPRQAIATQATPTRSDNRVSEEARVVVVVPARLRSAGDAQRLVALADALANQTRPGHVVVIDDASGEWPQLSACEVIHLRQNVGPAAARNIGLLRAMQLGAEVVAFTDADCAPAPDWIERIVLAFRRNRAAHAVSGATWSKDRSWLGRYHERNGTLNGRRLAGREQLLYGPTCNLALCAELAAELRFDAGFPHAAAEDIDFCCRAVQQGWSLVHDEEVKVVHDFGYDEVGSLGRLARFWRQFRKYGKGERILLAKQPVYPELFADSREIPSGASANACAMTRSESAATPMRATGA